MRQRSKPARFNRIESAISGSSPSVKIAFNASPHFVSWVGLVRGSRVFLSCFSFAKKALFKKLFGGEVVGSQYQDGHFVYQVVAGGGSGSDVYPPVLYVADVENATHFNNVLEP